MKSRASCQIVALFCLACSSATGAKQASSQPGASGLRVVSRISGPDGGFDYASFDAVRRRLYVALGKHVMAVDVDTKRSEPAFARGDGVQAVVPIPGRGIIATTNGGDNTVRLIRAGDGRVIASLVAGKNPDGAIFDPFSGLLLVAGQDSGTITLIDPKGAKIVGVIDVGGQLEYLAADGKGRLYVNVESKNEVAVVSLTSKKVTARYPLSGCEGPTGLALVSNERLISACANGVAKILDARSGHELASLKIGARPDAVLYDKSRDLAYIPSAVSGTLAVVALSGPRSNSIVDSVQTQIGARTGAVDEKTGNIYLPAAQYVLPVPADERPTPKPGTFNILVLTRGH